jgi:hypothetical protein
VEVRVYRGEARGLRESFKGAFALNHTIGFDALLRNTLRKSLGANVIGAFILGVGIGIGRGIDPDPEKFRRTGVPTTKWFLSDTTAPPPRGPKLKRKLPVGLD